MINLDDRVVTEILPRIKPKAFAVLMVIAKHLNKQNTAFPSRRTLMNLTGMGRDAVTKALHDLEKEGLIKRTQRTENGKFKSNLYTVTTAYIGVFIPANKAGALEETPCTENPYTEKPYTEKPYTESQDTISIKQAGSIKQNGSINQRRRETPPPHVNESELEPVQTNKEIYEALKDADDWKALICKNTYVGRKPISLDDLNILLEAFYNERTAAGKTWMFKRSFKAHFMNWLNKVNVRDKIQMRKRITQPQRQPEPATVEVSEQDLQTIFELNQKNRLA